MRTEFKWAYEPRDLFEQAEDLEIQDSIIRVEGGTAGASFSGDQSKDLVLQGRLTDDLNRLLVGQAFARRKSAGLVRTPSIVVVDDAGNRAVTLVVEDCVHVHASGQADVVAKDADGRIIRDTRAERIARQHIVRVRVAHWIGRHLFLATLIEIHRRAAEDRPNFLVHLYAIREAIRKKFGSESQAKGDLGISAGKWRRLGVLTNDLPLLEGRHIGKHHESLRPATHAEIEEAWGLADELLESYLAWLEKQAAGSAD